MGKGTIISGGPDGSYQVQVNFFREKIDAEIELLDGRIDHLTNLIAILPDGQERDITKLQKTALEKRKEFLGNFPEDETISAWCADLTENLSGLVGTVEVPGERGTVLIQPGYEGNATYSTSRDGQLLPVVGTTYEQFFYNLAMMPGWQKWKPTFRFGTITAIDGDAADVDLEAATSSQQGLNVNQTESLSTVSIEYMTCDGTAFEVGDVVLIKFESQDWESPKIVGFKDHPKPCYAMLLIRIDFDIYGTNVSFVWDPVLNEYATNIPDGVGGFVEMPTTYSELNYWINITDFVDSGSLWTDEEFESSSGELGLPDSDLRILTGTGSQYIDHVTSVCNSVDVVNYNSRVWERIRYDGLGTHYIETKELFINAVEHIETDHNGFTWRSAAGPDYEFKVHLDELITETIDSDEHLTYDVPPHIDSLTIDAIRGVTVSQTLQTPMGDYPLFDNNALGYTVDYYEADDVVINADVTDYFVVDTEVNYFKSRIIHSDTLLLQLHVAQTTLDTRQYPYKASQPRPFYASGTAPWDFGTWERNITTYVEVVCSVYVATDTIADDEYNPNDAERNDALSDAIKEIIEDSEELIESITDTFRI